MEVLGFLTYGLMLLQQLSIMIMIILDDSLAQNVILREIKQ